jgi:hypothetical protein
MHSLVHALHRCPHHGSNDLGYREFGCRDDLQKLSHFPETFTFHFGKGFHFGKVMTNHCMSIINCGQVH